MEGVDTVNAATGVRPNTGTSESGSAASLIRQATDPRTGVVDTRQVAGWVADAAKQDFNTASKAYTQIDAELSRTDPATAGHFSRDVGDAFAAQNPNGAGASSSTSMDYAAPLWVAGNQVSEAGKGVLRNNPILEIRWASTPNVAGKVGFTAGLKDLLESKGIAMDEYPRLNTLNPSNSPQYRTYNGNQARDAIASDYQQRQYTVRTEVTENTPFKTPRTPTGERHVDVSATKPGPTSETASRVDVESKLGRASLDGDTRLQAAKDVWRLQSNANVRGLGTAMDVGGKILGPVGVALDAWQIGSAIKEDGGHFGAHAQQTTAEVAGGAAGGWAGAETGAAAGAAIGTFIAPGIGTAIGGVIGGLLGGFGGSWLGSKAGDAAYDAAAHH
jgi:trimeric autotransporter adhesin